MRNRRKILERSALAVMAIGILMVWQPWLHVFFRLGFLVTIMGTIAFIVAAHLPGGASADAGGEGA